MKSSFIIVVVVIVIIVIAGAAFFALSGKSSTTTTSTSLTSSSVSSSSISSSLSSSSSSSSSTVVSSSSSSSTQATGSANLAAVQAATNTHISDVQSRNVPVVLSQYTNNATVVWTGQTGGLGGTYHGTSNIQILYAGALSTAKTLSLTLENYTAQSIDSTHANSTFGLHLVGYSPVLGNVTAHIQAEVAWIYNGTGWAIQGENWNYLTFTSTVSGGATTFPQWHTPSRESPDAFKNFVFHIGGPAYAFVIFGYVAVLVVLLLAFTMRRIRATSTSSSSVNRKSS